MPLKFSPEPWQISAPEVLKSLRIASRHPRLAAEGARSCATLSHNQFQATSYWVSHSCATSQGFQLAKRLFTSPSPVTVSVLAWIQNVLPACFHQIPSSSHQVPSAAQLEVSDPTMKWPAFGSRDRNEASMQDLNCDRLGAFEASKSSS